jgi:hypothetical protein
MLMLQRMESCFPSCNVHDQPTSSGRARLQMIAGVDGTDGVDGVDGVDGADGVVGVDVVGDRSW